MLARLFAIEWIKAVNRQASWAVLLFFAALVALFAGSSLYNQLWRQGAAFRLPEQWPAVVNVGALFGLFSVLALVVLLTADERGWRTDRQNVIDGLTRDQYFAGKALLLLLVASVFWAVAVGVGGGAALVGTAVAPSAEPPLRPADAGHLGGFLLFLLLVGAIALFFATVVPGSGGALAVAILFLLVQLILGPVLRLAGPPAEALADLLRFAAPCRSPGSTSRSSSWPPGGRSARATCEREGVTLSHRLRALGLLGLLGGCAPAPPAPEPGPILRAVLISDLNGPYGSTRYPPPVAEVVAMIPGAWRPDLVLVAGDMVAGQAPQLPDSVVWRMWQAFDATVAAPLRAAGIPLAPTLGNHDGSAYPAHARDRRLAVAYWRERFRGEPLPFVEREHYPLRYAFGYGPVHFVVWDATNQESGREAELLRWLREALASEPARRARHRVVLAHLPLYGVAEGRDRPGEVLANGDSLRTLLERWGATLFVSGHHHAYYPGRRGALELLHAGALGDGPRPLLGSGQPARRSLAVLDFYADSLAVTGYEVDPATGHPTEIPLRSLPRALCGHTGWVARRDLAALDTTCAGRDPSR